MRTIYTLIILSFLSFSSFSQTTKKTSIDTNEICMPYSVAQQILLDLNEYDKLKEVVGTYEKEVVELNNKMSLLKQQNESWIEDSKLSQEIILEKNKAIEIYKTENEDLRKENKRIKTKNGIYNIISAAIIVPLTYLLIIK